MAGNFDVFISYRRSDGTELAEIVRDYLKSRGLRVFLDTKELVDGQYFDTQLKGNVISAPNYILIATPDVFKFREGEDWVREEIRLALSEYKKYPDERVVIPFVPGNTVFPQAGLPEGLEDLPRVNRINLKDTAPTDKELLRLAKDVCRVNRHNMWNAGQRYLEKSKSERGRFHSLHIDERIMPLAHTKSNESEDNLPIRVKSGDNADSVALFDALDSQSGHMYLIGEGGIGKTTAMIRIMEQAYEDKKNSYTDNAVIPLFVELNRAPDSYSRWYEGAENLESSFIRREICRILLNENNIVHVADDYVDNLDEEFSKKTASPEYLLLLDGLNEVSTNEVGDGKGHRKFVRTLIVDEIKHLLTDCPNVRVMLTSRTDETQINCEEHNIQKLYLTGVDDETIRAYLDSNGKSAEIIDNALNNENLLNCLRIPLFLTIYAKLSDTRDVTSRGEILRQFFHERSKKLYSQQARIKDFHNDTNEKQLLFMLDFLLPAIGCKMERDGEFYLSAEQIAKIIEPVLTGRSDSESDNVEEPKQSKGFFKRLSGKNDTTPGRQNKSTSPDPTAIIGEYGKQFFNQYSHYKVRTSNVAKEILNSGETIVDVAEFVINCCVSVLGILQETSGKYGFIHHHIRDYFAAVCDINTLGLAVYINNENPKLAFKCLAPFIENANHREKSVFIGEYLGEHHNKPYLKGEKWQYNVPTKPCDRNLLKRALDILRGKFNGEVQYGCYNLIEPLKLVRKDLSGADFSNLDLQLVTLNGVRLGHTETGGANLSGSKLGMENLLNQGHSGSVYCVAYSPDGQTFISGSDDKTIKEWNVATGQCIRTYKGHSAWVKCVAYSPDGKSFISGSDDKTIKEWNRATGQCIRTYEGHTGNVSSVAYSPDGKSFISGSWDSTIKEWKVGQEECIRTYEGHSDSVNSVAYSPNGKSFISSSWDSTIKEWNIETGQCIRTYEEYITSVAYSPDGKTFICGSWNNTIKEWDIATGQCIRIYEEHSRSISSVVYSPDGKTFISGSWDNTIKEWDIATGQCIRIYEGHSDRVNFVVYSSDGKSFISCSSDKTIKEWDISTCQYIRIYTGHRRWVNSVAYSKDGKSFISGSADNTIKEWNTGTGECIQTYEGHMDWVNSVMYNPNGQSFISGSDDTTIREWNIKSGECVCIYKGHTDNVKSLVYNPDGQSFISGAWDYTIKMWNSGDNKCVCTLNGKSDFVHTVSYNPNSKLFISGSFDSTIKEWNVKTRQCIRTYEGHSAPVYSVTYRSDGKLFISGSADNTVKEWNISTGQCIRTYNGHSAPVLSVAYSPDGKYILSGSSDGTVRVWSTESGECVRVIRNYPGLIVLGCDMRNLHEDSNVDEDVLRQYGAIVD